MPANSLLVLKSNYDVLTIGDVQIGKTSLIYRFVSGEYVSDLPSDEELYSKMVVDKQGKYREFTILDASSNADPYSSARKQQILNANIIILMYSIDSLPSFHYIEEDIEFIKSIRNDIRFYLIATKMDLDDERQVNYEQGLELAQRINSLGFWECSAKNDINIDEAFNPVIDYLFELKNLNQQLSEKIEEQQIENRHSNLLVNNDHEQQGQDDQNSLNSKKSLQSKNTLQSKRSLQSIKSPTKPEKSGCCTIV